MQYLYKLIQKLHQSKESKRNKQTVQFTIHISSLFIDSISESNSMEIVSSQFPHLFVYKLLRGNHWFHIITNEEDG